jgi:hypothetical protein
MTEDRAELRNRPRLASTGGSPSDHARRSLICSEPSWRSSAVPSAGHLRVLLRNVGIHASDLGLHVAAGDQAGRLARPLELGWLSLAPPGKALAQLRASAEILFLNRLRLYGPDRSPLGSS